MTVVVGGGEVWCVKCCDSLFLSVLHSVHYSSGVGIHSFPPNGQLFAANLQDQGTYVYIRVHTG